MYEINITKLTPVAESERYLNRVEVYKRVIEHVDIAAISTVVEGLDQKNEVQAWIKAQEVKADAS